MLALALAFAWKRRADSLQANNELIENAAINLLAFDFHTVCDCIEDLWINARLAKRARKRLFEHIRTITAYLVFPSWDTLMQTLIDSKPPPEIEAQISL